MAIAVAEAGNLAGRWPSSNLIKIELVMFRISVISSRIKSRTEIKLIGKMAFEYVFSQLLQLGLGERHELELLNSRK